jgi:AraC-like DNA-binding protein
VDRPPHPGLDELWPRYEAEALAAALWEREQTIEDRLAILERALLARLHARADASARADALVRAGVRLIEAGGGALRVEDLAAKLNVSRQHLALQFRERVGLSAKTFAMVCQFRHAHAASFHFSNTRT